jgi:uncharacterized protein YcbK (DUF882 family)
MDHTMNQLVSRRDVIKASIAGALGMALSTNMAYASSLKLPDVGTFSVSFQNHHTGEVFDNSYRIGDKYLPDAFKKINHILRDYKTGEVFPIDPRVIDILYMVSKKTGFSQPLQILSGYRSQSTNASLSRRSEGVAKNSLHMTGQAIDFRLPGYSMSKVRKVAVNLRAGGVGYYRKSDFIHVDTGQVRVW